MNKNFKDLPSLDIDLKNPKSNSKLKKLAEFLTKNRMGYYTDKSGKIIPVDKDLEVLLTKGEDLNLYPESKFDSLITDNLKYYSKDYKPDDNTKAINLSKVMNLSSVLAIIKYLRVFKKENQELLQRNVACLYDQNFSKLLQDSLNCKDFETQCKIQGEKDKFIKQNIQELEAEAKAEEDETIAEIHEIQADLEDFKIILDPNYLKAKVFDLLLEKNLIVLDTIPKRENVEYKDNSESMDDAEKEAILSRPENLNDISPELLKKLVVKDFTTSFDETTKDNVKFNHEDELSEKDEQDVTINIGNNKSISLDMLTNNLVDNYSEKDMRNMLKIILKDYLAKKMNNAA